MTDAALAVHVGRFVAQAASIAHRYGKELFVDVQVSRGRLEKNSAENGQDYSVLLKSADRLVVWDYFKLSGYPPAYAADIARYLQRFGTGRMILSIGLWGAGDAVLSADELSQALRAASETGLQDVWITPSYLLSDEGWTVLGQGWAGSR